jgi:predicted amidohydrolase
MEVSYDLTYAEFVQRAAQLGGLDAELYPELYPMVRDLLRMARRVRELAPEVHAEIAVDSLSRDARGIAT